jgi:hypothetical protein
MAKELKKTIIYWVIGEATNSGKTTIATSLIRVLNSLGKPTIGFKPLAGIRFSQSKDLLINEIPYSDCGMFGGDALKLCDASPLTNRGMLDIINPRLLLFKDNILEPLLIRIGSKKLNNLDYFRGEFLEEFLKDDENKQVFKQSLLPIDCPMRSVENVSHKEAALKYIFALGPDVVVMEGAGPFLPVWAGSHFVNNILMLTDGKIYFLKNINLKLNLKHNEKVHVKMFFRHLKIPKEKILLFPVTKVTPEKIEEYSNDLIMRVLSA